MCRQVSVTLAAIASFASRLYIFSLWLCNQQVFGSFRYIPQAFCEHRSAFRCLMVIISGIEVTYKFLNRSVEFARRRRVVQFPDSGNYISHFAFTDCQQ